MNVDQVQAGCRQRCENLVRQRRSLHHDLRSGRGAGDAARKTLAPMDGTRKVPVGRSR